MDDKGKWVKLKVGNDWGVEYYSHNPHNKYGTCDSKLGIHFQDGQSVLVRWPDGSTSDEKLTVREIHTSVNDCGKSYPVSYKLAVIDKTVLGLSRTVFLNEVEIWEEN
jgi:hypothetical protein